MSTPVFLKLRLFVFTLLCHSGVWAQITLTQTDFPMSGDHFFKVSANVNSGTQPGESAQNKQHWDFENAFIPKDSTEVLFGNLNASHPDTLFKHAQTVVRNTANGDRYFRSSISGFYLDGLYYKDGQNSLHLKYDTSEVIMPAHFTMNDSMEYLSGLEISYTGPQDNYKIEIRTENKLTCDGYGSLKTPAAYYENTLRLKRTVIQNTKVYVFYNNQYHLVQDDDSSYTEYNWFRKGKNSWVMQMNINESKTQVKAQYLSNISTSTMPQPEGSIHPFSAYPNPTSGLLFIDKVPENNNVDILNLQGLLVHQTRMHNGFIDMSNLPKGLYFLRINQSYYKITLQ